MTDVFISYSRNDEEFVRSTFNALEQHGRDAWVDWEDIPRGEEWLKEIYAGIENADTFVFVVSPSSLTSEICNYEVHHAINNNKRIIPLIFQDVVDEKTKRLREDIVTEWRNKAWENTARANWEQLKAINWLFFRATDDFDTEFEELLKTINTDQEYLRAHTRLLVRAWEWERGERNLSLLLRGDDLSKAETWGDTAARKEQKLTELQIEYIRESRAVERRRQRNLLVGVSVALVITLVLAILSFGLFQQSENNLGLAQERGTIAADQANTSNANAVMAENNAATSEANLREAWNTQALFLANAAQQRLAVGNTRQAIWLALEGLKHYPEGIFNSENYQALLDTLVAPGSEQLYLDNNYLVDGAKWNAEESRLLTWTITTVKVWDANSGELLFILRHDAGLYNVAWNTDETRLLTATKNGVYIWDAADGDLIRILRSETKSESLHAVWHPDGERILTWSDDGTARVWDASTGEQLIAFHHNDWRISAAWNADGTRILTKMSTEEETLLQIWSTNGGELLSTLNGRDAIWNANNTRLLIFEDDKLKIFDTKEFNVLFTLQHDNEVQEAIWDPTGTRFLAWSRDTVRIWDASTGEQLAVLRYDDSCWLNAAWNADGTRIVTQGCGENLVRLWDAGTGEQLFTLHSDDWVNGIMWNTDGTRVLTWARDNTARIWDAMTGQELLTILHEWPVQGAMWNSDETLLLTWAGEGGHVWNIREGTASVSLQYDGGESTSGEGLGAIWSQTENRVLIWRDNLAQIWDAEGGEVTLTLRHDSPVRGAIWNSDETLIVVWLENNTIQIWDVQNGDLLQTLFSGYRVNGVAWNVDGTRLLSWGGIPHTSLPSDQGYAVCIWDAEGGELLFTLMHDRAVYGAAWNAAGTRVLTWAEDNTARVWDAQNSALLFTATEAITRNTTGASDNVWFPGAAWDVSGRYLLTSGNVRLWDTENDKLLFESDNTISEIAIWDPTGTRFLTWTPMGELRVWNAQSGELLVTLQKNFQDMHLVNFTVDSGWQYSMAWNADGTKVIGWPAAPVAWIWGIEHGEPLLTLFREDYKIGFENNTIDGAMWSPDETQVLTWTFYGAVRIWDAENSELLLTLQHDSNVEGAIWSPDGTRVLTWSRDKMFRIWTVDFIELFELATRSTLRPLTNNELASFLLPTLASTLTPTEEPTLTLLPSVTPLPTSTFRPTPTQFPSPTMMQFGKTPIPES